MNPTGSMDRTASSRGLPQPSVPETLRAMYERYREVEARELISLLPREGLRSLWRLSERATAGSGPAVALPDSLEGLRAVAVRLLPLPPYEVWVRSYLADRTPYLERLGIPEAPSRPEPVTISTRCIEEGLWAHLNLLNRDGTWSGFIVFHGSAVETGIRTAEIFRGEDPGEIRERFLGFTLATLRAFLRSVA